MKCSACNKEAKVLGSLIIIPTSLGILFAILMCYSSVSATNTMMLTTQLSKEYASVAMESSFDFWCAFSVGLCSLAVGSIGWLLIMKRKLYKCVRCSYMVQKDIQAVEER